MFSRSPYIPTIIIRRLKTLLIAALLSTLTLFIYSTWKSNLYLKPYNIANNTDTADLRSLLTPDEKMLVEENAAINSDDIFGIKIAEADDLTDLENAMDTKIAAAAGGDSDFDNLGDLNKFEEVVPIVEGLDEFNDLETRNRRVDVAELRDIRRRHLPDTNNRVAVSKVGNELMDQGREDVSINQKILLIDDQLPKLVDIENKQQKGSVVQHGSNNEIDDLKDNSQIERDMDSRDRKYQLEKYGLQQSQPAPERKTFSNDIERLLNAHKELRIELEKIKNQHNSANANSNFNIDITKDSTQSLPKPQIQSFSDSKLSNLKSKLLTQTSLLNNQVSTMPGATFPKLVHITVKDKNSPKNIAVGQRWKLINPDHTVILYDDDDMAEFVKFQYPEFYSVYNLVFEQVERSDIWRYLILHAKGGVYADSDWVPNRPINTWQDHIDQFDLKNGFENYQNPLFNGIQINQWGMYACKGHSIFYDTVAHINHIVTNELITRQFLGQSVARTGPTPFTWSVIKYLFNSGARLSGLDRNSNYKWGDVLIARWDVFSWGDNAIATHLFKGSWKSEDWMTEQLKAEPSWEKKTKDKFNLRVRGFWNGIIKARL